MLPAEDVHLFVIEQAEAMLHDGFQNGYPRQKKQYRSQNQHVTQLLNDFQALLAATFKQPVVFANLSRLAGADFDWRRMWRPCRQF
jgi:transcriptional regulator GlxA family with amidase domain